MDKPNLIDMLHTIADGAYQRITNEGNNHKQKMEIRKKMEMQICELSKTNCDIAAALMFTFLTEELLNTSARGGRNHFWSIYPKYKDLQDAVVAKLETAGIRASITCIEHEQNFRNNPQCNKGCPVAISISW